MSNPMTSVIIATHNRARFVGSAIQSAQNQTVQDIEIIVVDDGSTDLTPQVLAQYSDHIRIIKQPNHGRSAARNAGVESALGDIIAFLDSDDIWLPNKLASQLSVFELYPEVGLVHTLSDVVDENGYPLQQHTRNRRKLYRRALKRGYNYEGMSEECIMFLSTVAVRRECWDGAGPMDLNTPAFEDWDWYLRAAMLTEIATVPKTLVHFRKHAGNTSAQEFFEGRVKTCHKHLALLDKRPEFPQKERARRNFYLQLAGAYYVTGGIAETADWMRKAVRVHPMVFLHPVYLRYSLAMCLPAVVFRGMRWISRQFTREIKN